jgi:hypothetical protein
MPPPLLPCDELRRILRGAENNPERLFLDADRVIIAIWLKSLDMVVPAPLEMRGSNKALKASLSKVQLHFCLPEVEGQIAVLRKI